MSWMHTKSLEENQIRGFTVPSLPLIRRRINDFRDSVFAWLCCWNCNYILARKKKMTQDEIIRMAREAGFTDYYPERLTRFAVLVAAHEREACAKLCIEEAERHEEMSQYEDTADYAERCLVYGKHIRTCAAAIRARGNDAS